MLNKITISILIIFSAIIVSQTASAEAIASTPNGGGGYIVLTNEPCINEGKTYKSLNRFYSYISSGFTTEGCYGIEDDTVITVWQPDGDKRRYPISVFTINKRGQQI
jgi:hypothetical protein